jgi:lysophospholipase L1-like esterase
VTEETKAKLVIIEPFYITTDRDPTSVRTGMQEALVPYRKTAERMAKQFKAPFVRFHSMFQQQLKNHPADRFCPEPVHPNATGHLLMAHEWLKTMGW